MIFYAAFFSLLLHALFVYFPYNHRAARLSDLEPIEVSFSPAISAPAPAPSKKSAPLIRSARIASKPAAQVAVKGPGEKPSTGSDRVEETVSSNVASGAAVIGEGSAAMDFRSELWVAIESVKEYPATARARHQTGKVKVGFTLRKNGLIDDVHLSEKSDYEILNSAAIDTLRRLGRFRAIPDDVSMVDLSFTVPLNFTLND